MTDVEKQVEIEHKGNKTLQRLLQVSSVVAFILIVITLIFVKRSKPEFPLGWIIFFIILALIIFLIIFFIFQIKNFLKKFFVGEVTESTLPPSITKDRAREIAEEQLMNKTYADYFGGEPLEEGTEVHGQVNQNIYSIMIPGYYKENYQYFIAMNMHYPKEKIRVLINPKKAILPNVKRLLAVNPEKLPDREIIERDNPLLGTRERITKIKKEEDKKEKKVEEKGEVEE